MTIPEGVQLWRRLPARNGNGADQDVDERALVHAFQDGDPGAYDDIYSRYERKVAHLCQRMLCDVGDAEEAAQETFLKVHQALPRFNGRYQLGAWITRIATNACLDQLRSRTRNGSQLVPLEELDLEPGPPETDADPETFVLNRLNRRRVRKVLNGLPPLHRAAIVLRDLEGLSYRDIAIALEITEPQVKALIHRARKGFRRSWRSTVASALIPAPLLQRLRKVDTHGADNVAQASRPLSDAAASFSHAAASCGTALHHCGQFVSERLATAATAAVITAAAASPAAAPPPAPAVVEQPVAGTEEPAKRSPTSPTKRAGGRGDSGETTSSPSPTPSPTPTPTASPSPTEQSGTSSGAGPKVEPSPTPSSPTPPLLHLGGIRPRVAAEPTVHRLSFDCATGEVDQYVETVLYEGAQQHRATLHLRVTSGANIHLEVEKNDLVTMYNGGSSDITRTRSGAQTKLEFAGLFGWNGGADPQVSGLPRSGSFRFRMTLDCSAGTLFSERLELVR